MRTSPVKMVDPKTTDQPEKADAAPLKAVDPPTEDPSSDATLAEIEHLREKRGDDAEPEELPLKEQE